MTLQVRGAADWPVSGWWGSYRKKVRETRQSRESINCALYRDWSDLKTLHGIQLCIPLTFLTSQPSRSSPRVSKLQTHPAMADDKPNCKVILANNIAKSVLEEVKDGLSKIERKPLLVGFLSSSDPAARVYAEWTGKTCTEK
jgi:hypothetical protein